jgi:hypothetical protein
VRPVHYRLAVHGLECWGRSVVVVEELSESNSGRLLACTTAATSAILVRHAAARAILRPNGKPGLSTRAFRCLNPSGLTTCANFEDPSTIEMTGFSSNSVTTCA